MALVYIIRHAEAASREDPSFADDDRPLVELGLKQSRALGKALAAKKIQFDVILCSPLPRAKQTAEEMLTTLAEPKPPIQYTDELAPGAKAKRIDEELLRYEGKTVAIVGHEPDLGEFAARMIGSKKARIKMPKAGVACINCRTAPGKGSGSLQWLVGPAWFMAE